MNGFGVIVVGLVLGIVVVAMVKRRHAKGGGTSRANQAAAMTVPKFRVVAIGLQGSGKTLLLTSIYRRLQTPGDRGFYLKAPHDQLMHLNQWYQELANSDLDWPSGTRSDEMREFEFSVMTHVEHMAEPVLKVGYLEYPGELHTKRAEPGETAQGSLLTAIKQADALIGIIDGLRLLQALQGNQRGWMILMSTVDAMVNSMLESRAPISFVITKWDLLTGLHANENARLDMVRTLLMGIEGFRDLVRIHSVWRVIRLVPVTAVGPDFAVLQDGKIYKRPTGRVRPANVDLALATVVPDILRQVELSLDQATRTAFLAEAQRRVRMGPGEALRSLGMYVADKAGRMMFSSVAGGLLGEVLFLDSRRDTGQQYSARLAALSEADRRAELFVQARRRVVHELQRQVTIMETRLPSSRLGSEF